MCLAAIRIYCMYCSTITHCVRKDAAFLLMCLFFLNQFYREVRIILPRFPGRVDCVSPLSGGYFPVRRAWIRTSRRHEYAKIVYLWKKAIL